MLRAPRLIAALAGCLFVVAASAAIRPPAPGGGAPPPASDPAPRLAAYARQRFRAGDFAAALALRRRLLRLALRRFGSASYPAARAMTGLARLYIEMHRYLDAEPLLILARRDLLRLGGPGDPALTPVLCGLARIARARGAARQAQEWAAEAVALAAGERRGQGAQYGAALRALAGALAAEKHFAESARALRRALAFDRRQGPDSEAIARDLAALGMVYIRQKRYAAALPPIEQAALFDQTRLGPTHPYIADDFHELGLAYLGLHRLDAAAAALRFAIWVLVRGAGSGTTRLAYTELTLARVMHQQGHADKAAALFDDAQRILGKAERAERRREDRA